VVLGISLVWSSRLAGAYCGVEPRGLEESGEVSWFSHEAREVLDASGTGLLEGQWLGRREQFNQDVHGVASPHEKV
jgi:hypothetical protein